MVFELMTGDTPWQTGDPFEIVAQAKKGLQKCPAWPADAGGHRVEAVWRAS